MCILLHSVVVRETLENRGVLGQLRARIRAEVFSALNDPTDSRPEVSHENFLINELIREYLDFNHYKYASSVLAAGLYVYFENNYLTLLGPGCQLKVGILYLAMFMVCL